MTLPSERTGALDWRRLHPLTLVVEIGSALRQVALVVVFIGADVIELGNLVELAVVFGPLGAALARWYTTRYNFDGETLHFNRGLLWRRRQVLPRRNVQNVSSTAGIVARLGSVVELQISDASSNGDVSLRFISQDDAEQLTTLLRGMPTDSPTPVPADVNPGDPPEHPALPGTTPAAWPDPTGPAVAGPAPLAAARPLGTPVASPSLVSPSLGRIAATEATSLTVAGAWAVLVVVVAVISVLGLVAEARGDLAPRWLDELPLPWWLLMVSVVGVALAVTLIQLVGRVLLLGGFTLVAEPDRLRIRVGLLTESRIAARRDRIQQLRVARDLPHGLLGIERVQFETADLDLPDAPGTRFLAPTGPTGQWRALAIEVFGHLDLDEADLSQVSPLARRRTLFRAALPVVVVIPTALVHPALAGGLALVWLAVARWYSLARYQQLGWAVSPDQLLVRSGVVARRLRLVDLDKVQTVRVRATWFQRRLDLATLQVDTAGRGFAGLVTVPDLPAPAARRLSDSIAGRAATTPVHRTL